MWGGYVITTLYSRVSVKRLYLLLQTIALRVHFLPSQVLNIIFTKTIVTNKPFTFAGALIFRGLSGSA